MNLIRKHMVIALLLSALMAGLLIFPAGETASAATAACYGTGDASGDGRVSAYDALCILRNGTKTDETSLIRSDVDLSGKADKSDAAALMEYLAGKRASIGTEAFTYACTSGQWGSAIPFWSYEYRRVADNTFRNMTWGYVSAYSKNMYYTGDWAAYAYSYADDLGIKVHPSLAADTVRTFTAPVSGTVTLSLTAKRESSFNALGTTVAGRTPSSVAVYLNSSRVDPVAGEYRLVADSLSYSVTLPVSAGDKIRICIGAVGNVNADAVRLDTSVSYQSFTKSGSAPQAADLSGKYYIAVTDQKNKRIVLYDAVGDWSSQSSVAWEWTPTLDDYTSTQVKSRFNHLTDAKLRVLPDGRKVVLITASGRGQTMVDYETKRKIWFAAAETGSNPHSIELLPDGSVVTAESNGHLYLYPATSSGYPNGAKNCKSYDCGFAHGVLWDPDQNVLWAIGSYDLYAYTYDRNSKTLTQKAAYNFRDANLGTAGHDLSAFYGDKNQLILSNNQYVLTFNKTTHTFSASFAGNQFLNYNGVKGISVLPTSAGRLYAFTCQDNIDVDQTWRTKTAYFVLETQINGQTCYTGWTRRGSTAAEDDQYYKVRLWDMSGAYC